MVHIVPLLARDICHNVRCRVKLSNNIKLLGGLEPGYEACLCLRCAAQVLLKGFEYNGRKFPKKIRNLSKKPRSWIKKALE